jgi:hypothetical protein
MMAGGERGIRTLGRGVSPYNGLANRRLQPLGHLSGVYWRIISEPAQAQPERWYAQGSVGTFYVLSQERDAPLLKFTKSPDRPLTSLFRTNYASK